MHRFLVAVLAAAPFILTAGTCGSVIRGHVPENWVPGPQGNWVRDFGDLQIEAGPLVRREGSSMHLKITNLGAQPVDVLGAELQAGATREAKETKDVRIAAAGNTALDLSFERIVHERRAAVVVKFSTGELRIDLWEP